MKLQTNYDNMTDMQLFLELQHRYDTFGESLGGYQEGGIQIGLWGELVWLNYLEDDLNGQAIHLAFRFDPETEEDIVVYRQDEKRFREILLLALEEKFTLFNACSYDGQRDQQEYLEDMKCTVCEENCSPTYPESLEAVPAPLPGHFDVREQPTFPFQYSPELTTAGFHEREAEHLDIRAYRKGKLRVLDAPVSTSTALVPYYITHGLAYDVEVTRSYGQNDFHIEQLQTWRHFEGERFKTLYNPPLLLRVGPDNRGW